ncbi:hypothetical protein MYCTH_2063555 [Thermothelomyces thermophilus ATCC 42464]|uniref:Alpha/beta hydrolase fold-3 domain-containing protein n=1 Tax=Thermothelomyces thermophilus (strain ATCC 42464 / BCRC 31852 / DSM 1799) TaxID=573729 RepID=G2QGE8_THET4|nr:uncharacterized protein MYCTH_2063555 [Thermothelomyces thermophilus ATCC 42464]AEO58562.1 hypothetical protein MYCTH_2063555 [Thermothelomyces thermophilus ATCC 42464]
MKETQTPTAQIQVRNNRANRLLSYCYTLVATPFLLSRFALDVVLYLVPWMRPAREWTLNQAVRVRVVRLVLLYWSLLRWGDRLHLRPGREGNRFEEKPEDYDYYYYRGDLAVTTTTAAEDDDDDDAVRPEPIGATWTPARPPPPALVRPGLVVALHFHGGGFAVGNGRDADAGFAAQTLIRHMGCTHVCAPQYRLASSGSGNGRFPAPVQDALTAYLFLVRERGIPGRQIVVSGDSAGGTIALGLVRYIAEHGAALGIPRPGAVALWSPWVDVAAALQHDMRASPNYRTDYLNNEFGRWGAAAVSGYGAVDPSGPYLAPLHHPFRLGEEEEEEARPPPMFIHGGDREVLWDDIELLARRYADAGWTVHLHRSRHCPHDLILLGPRIGFAAEAEEAARAARTFFLASTDLKLRERVCVCVCMPAMANGTPAGPGRPDDDGLSFDVLIVGAGISGINAAYRIQTEGPADTTYAILEGRDSLGGTWDLFRYPGIRSDSDIYTFGFPWSPWRHDTALASGDQIKAYLAQSARSQGIDQHILYRHRVVSADWSSAGKEWDLRVVVDGREDQPPAVFRARFLLLGTGYYDYEKPLEAAIPGIETFAGKVIHPQFWPEDYDYTDKEVVIIGSGATAVTVLPAMAERARRVTMLQRSPGYVFSLPSRGLLTALLFAVLPAAAAHYLCRLLWLVRSHLTTAFCRAWPALAKRVIKRATLRQLPPTIPWDPHFRPRYNPWEQRFCACVDGDFFAALRSGKADVVTDTIRTVTPDSIELGSGRALHPDVIVTATGLKLRFGGGIDFRVDGEPFRWRDKFAWRSAMLQDVPNLLFLTGYETASWTLGADVSARLFVRILRRLRHRRAAAVVPRPARPDMPERPMMSLTSTYLRTARDVLPKGGTGVWAPKTNYFADMARARWGDLSKDLEFIM